MLDYDSWTVGPHLILGRMLGFTGYWELKGLCLERLESPPQASYSMSKMRKPEL
jgi:hypothetical protein